jgi:co-chaperonin GroES (HSP10)
MSGYFPDKIFKGTPKPEYLVILRRVMTGEQITHGGIVLPPGADEAAQPTCLGTVLAVGEGVTDFNVGDNVVFLPYPARGISISLRGGKEAQTFIHQEDVYGKYTLDDATEKDHERWAQEDRASQGPRLVVPNEQKLVT